MCSCTRPSLTFTSCWLAKCFSSSCTLRPRRTEAPVEAQRQNAPARACLHSTTWTSIPPLRAARAVGVAALQWTACGGVRSQTDTHTRVKTRPCLQAQMWRRWRCLRTSICGSSGCRRCPQIDPARATQQGQHWHACVQAGPMLLLLLLLRLLRLTAPALQPMTVTASPFRLPWRLHGRLLQPQRQRPQTTARAAQASHARTVEAQA